MPLDRAHTAVIDRLSEIALKTPGVHERLRLPVSPCSPAQTHPRPARSSCRCKPSKNEKARPELSAQSITRRLSGAFSQVQEGLALVFPPPPVRGIGSAGGFKLQIQDRSGLHTPSGIAIGGG
jgi:multidrug efflux pump subunit AcrB